MQNSVRVVLAAVTAAGSFAILPAHTQAPPTPEMSFFVTSVGMGDGANLGGLKGADGHCMRLADAVGAGAKLWRAYLSEQPMNGVGEVHARDRIGTGPWHNAEGVEIAANVEALHGGANNINETTALNERGEWMNGDGQPSRHDILTGTQPDGRTYDEDYDKTCGNWTSNGPGEAMVGHHDLQRDLSGANFWNNAHVTRGCSQSNLASTGGGGLFYCFAVTKG